MLAATLAFLLAAIATNLTGNPAWTVSMSAANEAQSRGEFAAAETGYRAALDAAGIPILQAFTLTTEASMYARAGRFADAEKNYRRAAALAASSGDHRIALHIASNLATLYLETGQLSRAEHTLAPFSDSTNSSPLNADSATLLSNLAAIRASQHRYPEAEIRFRQVIDGLASARDDETLLTRAIALGNLSGVLVHTDRRAEAAGLARQSLAILESVGIDKVPELVIKARTNVALFDAADGNAVAAEGLFQSVVHEAEAAFGPDSYLVGTVLRSYAEFLHQQKRRRDAHQVEERSARILAPYTRENALGSTVEASTLRPSFLK